MIIIKGKQDSGRCGTLCRVEKNEAKLCLKSKDQGNILAIIKNQVSTFYINQKEIGRSN